jgi:hypothetical protein
VSVNASMKRQDSNQTLDLANMKNPLSQLHYLRELDPDISGTAKRIRIAANQAAETITAVIYWVGINNNENLDSLTMRRWP